MQHMYRVEEAHVKAADEVATELGVSLDTGLSDTEANKRKDHIGENALPVEESSPMWKLVLKQFDDPLVKILLVSAFASFATALAQGGALLNALVEPLVILAILIANAAVGVATESNAEASLASLKQLQPDRATVVRNDGQKRVVHAAELVPGDVMLLSVGDKVPADCRIAAIGSRELRCDQALLTGESASVPKHADACVHASSASDTILVQDMHCMLFSGTIITRGSARCVVVSTGSRTAIGRIRDSIAASAQEMTPLKRKLDEFGALLSKLIAGICVAVWVVSIGRFTDPAHGGVLKGAMHYFKTSVALAVAAIPEGLPAVVTTCLALGTRKMARRNAIVRTLPSVETLGCVSAICSDKTGTLTTNQMSVRRLLMLNTSSHSKSSTDTITVSGSTFEPSGSVKDSSERTIAKPCDQPAVNKLAQCCCMCNDSHLTYNSHSQQFERIGENTEVALLVLAEKLGLPSSTPLQPLEHSASKHHQANTVRRYWETVFSKKLNLEFTRDRKMMSTLCEPDPGSASTDATANVVFTKGAPEKVLSLCTKAVCNSTGQETEISDSQRSTLLSILNEHSEAGLRLLALAYKVVDTTKHEIDESDEQALTFAGAVGMHDPPREEVRAAIQTCRSAGIRTIVVTGDNLATAESICKQVGALDPSESARDSGKALTGTEFEMLDEDARKRAAAQVALFARVEPHHKQALVEALKQQGEVVAMTGDGVNDAPALKKADIGIAMGSGTAVARYASDMVLADDNFSTIVAAVKEGRAIYNNTKQFIRYMVSSNIGEVVCIFIASLLQMPEPLIPVQLLWVNLVTDGLPATALGFNAPDSDVMKQKPRATQAPIVDRWLLVRYIAVGTYVGIATIAGFIWWFVNYENGPQLSLRQLMSAHTCSDDPTDTTASVQCSLLESKAPLTMAMSVLVLVEMFNALNALSENASLLTLPPFSNKLLLGAIGVSVGLHLLILYLPVLATLFSVVPLGWSEWKVVLLLSAGVIPLDEVLKLLTRRGTRRRVSAPSAASFLTGANGYNKR